MQDLIDRYGEVEIRQLTDRAEPPAGQVDTAIANTALADASAVIDFYLAQIMSVPVSPAPTSLKAFSCVLARRALYLDAVPPAADDAANSVMKTLELIAQGKMFLDPADTPTPDPTEPPGGDVRFASEERLTGGRY